MIGDKAMTLSGDAFAEIKQMLGGQLIYRDYMPLLKPEVDAFIRASYKGGWTYLRMDRAEKVYENVHVYDVNSLYPWAMAYTPLPYGRPFERKPYGDELYIINFEAEFNLKPGYLPTVQVKTMPAYYHKTEYIVESTVLTELTMTNIDYEIFKEHYDITYMTEPKYMCFKAKTGLLKPYIDKYMEIKERATLEHDASTRFLAKRKMNSPYGKTGMRGNRKNKIPTLEGEEVNLDSTYETSADTIYVPYATFVTAQARNKTIRSAQKNYDNFIYADTDSLHLIGDGYNDLEIHDTHIGAWKLEGVFEYGKYLRPKTYIHAHSESGNMVVDEIKCAGMQDSVKVNCKWEDFYIGKNFPNARKLQMRVPGGVVLVDRDFTIKDNGFTTRDF